MTPYVLMSRLEGLLGSGLRAARAPQNVAIWVKVMREIIFSTGLRDATDFELGATNDVIQTDTSVDSSGGTVYGWLVDSIFDVSGEHLIFLIADTTTQTLSGVALGDGGAANFGANTEAILDKIRPAADQSNAVFQAAAYPDGRIYATQIEVSADGEEGTNPTALDVRSFIVYRSGTEVRVGT